ncbi:hypothetical protein BCR35DRAFT_209970 [Leucosporidium creatinivorum]|uniref:Uncharacterized protein n=1 Tax=Leucosporidium creatinivorum TaxID=106004 RepID=A0A1Y2DEJ4_9BASI|nr:hypothetical protein BCR35DRAFT_209970 [Leucosporidium creatinivorum]
MHSSPLSQPHSPRPSASRHRTSPSAIPSPTESASKLDSTTTNNGTRRYSHNSAMSTSPRTSNPEQHLSISATRLPSAPASPSTRPRAPTTTSEHRGRSSTTSSSVPDHQRTPSQSSRDLVVEKRRRRESVEPAAGEATTPEHIRPPLHTYTSFETAFGVEAPRSPEGSPTKTESKGWWGRS